MSAAILIKPLTKNDCETIANAFLLQGWDKPLSQYEKYLKEQESRTGKVLVAHLENEFSGYVTVVWQSGYPPLRDKNIPEIVDLNVLVKFRNRGVGTALLNEAENLISRKFNFAGIGVGLTRDYGAAQRIYVKRGYVPDGLGISQKGIFPGYGDKITVDDYLNLYFIKELHRP